MKFRQLATCTAFVMVASLATFGAATPSMSAQVRRCVPTFTPNPLQAGQNYHFGITGFDPAETFTQHELIVSGAGAGGTSDTDYKADGSGNFGFDSSGTIPLIQDHSVWRFTWTGKTSGTTCTLDVSVGSSTTSTTAAPTTTTTSPATTTTAPAAEAAAVATTPRFTG